MRPLASRQDPGARVLYLSYDGMCDPLGASQVLPYLFGLSRLGHRITLVSFEKPDRSAEARELVDAACREAGIEWHPLTYRRSPPVLSTMADVGRMAGIAEGLNSKHGFDLVHCRSYIPALVGLRLKRRHKVPFLFDMRGFWADERVDGHLWNLANPLFRAIYNYFKRRENDFLKEADHVVSLTEVGREILLERRGEEAGPPISVIPCCTDFDAFPTVSATDRRAARNLLEISTDARVAAYLGSFGSWYLVDEMLDFFRVQLERDPGAIFLVISREPPEEIKATATRRGVPADRVIVRGASRAEIPKLVAAADYGLFFIMPVFSKRASSPTKMGELLALELPMVTNAGVGDVDRIMAETGAGVVVKGFDTASYLEALNSLEQLKPDTERWRNASRRWFDLDMGVERYDAIYRSLAKAPVGSHNRIG